MGYVENLQQEAEQAAKAEALDTMQKEAEAKRLVQQGYEAGRKEVLKAVQARLSPQAQRERNLYEQQQMEAAGMSELDDNRSLFEKGMDGLAGMFSSDEQQDPRVAEIQNMQQERGQPVMSTEYLSDWLKQQDSRGMK